jgi:hypothetical protein
MRTSRTLPTTFHHEIAIWSRKTTNTFSAHGTHLIWQSATRTLKTWLNKTEQKRYQKCNDAHHPRMQRERIPVIDFRHPAMTTLPRGRLSRGQYIPPNWRPPVNRRQAPRN